MNWIEFISEMCQLNFGPQSNKFVYKNSHTQEGHNMFYFVIVKLSHNVLQGKYDIFDKPYMVIFRAQG